jgi:AAHS family 4-hydroxybenzoate transporter-like MFS transporter
MSQTEPVLVDTDEALGNARLEPYHFLVGLACAAVLYVDGYNASVIGYVAPSMSHALGISRAALGSVLSAGGVGSILGLLLSAYFTPRAGVRRVTICAVILFGVAELCAAMSGTLYGVGGFRFAAAIGLSAAMVSAVSVVGEFFPRRWRSSAVTYIFLGNTLGQMSSGGVSHLLFARGLSWQAPIIFGGVTALLLTLVLIVLLPDSPEYLVNRSNTPLRALQILRRIRSAAVPPGAQLVSGIKEAPRASVRELFAQGNGLLTVLFWTASAMNLIAAAFLGFLPTILVDSGLKLDQAILTTVFVTAAGIVAGFTVGPLMDRLNPLLVACGLMVVGALGATALAIVEPLSVVYLFAAAGFVLGYCNSGMSKGVYALAVYLYPTAVRSVGLSWTVGVGRLGLISGPMLIGLMLQAHWPTAMVFQAEAVPLLIGAAALFLAFGQLRAKGRRAAAAEPLEPTAGELGSLT